MTTTVIQAPEQLADIVDKMATLAADNPESAMTNMDGIMDGIAEKNECNGRFCGDADCDGNCECANCGEIYYHCQCEEKATGETG